MPITSYQIVQASNDPTGPEYMDSTSPQYLVTEITDIKTTVRNLQLGLPWITLLGLTSVSWTGALAWTRINNTQARIQGDQTAATGTGYLVVGQRVQAFVTAGTIYGYISAVSFGSPNTTVTFIWDNGAVLDTGLSDIQTAGDILGTPPGVPITLTNRYKHADQSATGVDTDLTLAVGKSQLWTIQYTLFYGGTVGSGSFLTITPTVPAGATFNFGTQEAINGGTSWVTGTQIQVTSAANFIRLFLSVLVAGTAGNVTISYADGFSAGSNTIKALSHMRAIRYF